MKTIDLTVDPESECRDEIARQLEIEHITRGDYPDRPWQTIEIYPQNVIFKTDGPISELPEHVTGEYERHDWSADLVRIELAPNRKWLVCYHVE